MSKWQLLIQSYKIYNYLSLNINVYQKLLVFFIWTNPWISSLILFKVITEPFFEIVEWPKDSIEGGFRSGLLGIKIVKKLWIFSLLPFMSMFRILSGFRFGFLKSLGMAFQSTHCNGWAQKSFCRFSVHFRQTLLDTFPPSQRTFSIFILKNIDDS